MRLSRRKFDLVHLPDSNPLELPGRKRVVTIHHGAVLEDPALLEPGYARWALDWIAREVDRADLVIAVSQRMRLLLLERYALSEDRVVAVPLGIDPMFSAPRTAPTGARDLLYVGRISHNKNVATVCRTFARLSVKHPDLSLTLVGPLDVPEEVVRGWVGDARALDRVRLLGRLAPDSPVLAAAYAGATVLLFLSLAEGWASPPLEAMAAGLPVVVSNRSSLPETVGDAGVLVDPLDVDECVAAVDRLLESPSDYQAQVEKGIRRARLFNWPETARQTLAAYSRVLSE